MNTIFYHYTDNYLLNPTHPVTVMVAGCGGTGSQVLANLAKLNIALLKLGHPGINVTAYDADTISESNIGRQFFYPSDMGCNKAITIISRINRSFGFGWGAIPSMLNSNTFHPANITITCVDSAKARINIATVLKKKRGGAYHEIERQLYWLDLGNSKSSGQVVLGTLNKIIQPKVGEKVTEILPTILDMFPNLEEFDNEQEQGPSCSLAEALSKQDLYINSIIAQFGTNLIWKLFREVKIKYQGAFINLDSLVVNPIKIVEAFPPAKSKRKKK